MTKNNDAFSRYPTVVEETQLLENVQQHLSTHATRLGRGANYDTEMLELRDAMAVAHPEDLPSLVEQMTRLQAIAAQRGQGDDLPIDPSSPYFGHLRLKEDGKERDVLIGKRTYLAPEQGVRIVDWRNAPVSRIYYCYEEGDDYEESFGGKPRRGIVTARRSITIQDGDLKRISSIEGVFVRRKGTWLQLDGIGPQLSGGQGISVRADHIAPVRGRLGVDADGTDRKDKHLPEISALLDRAQFELISSNPEDFLVVQGSAGSGKTTVGLHRIAWLAYQKQKRLDPRKMVVIVQNNALSHYVAGVLPALGVQGVRVITFERWASTIRKRLVPELPDRYSDDTPTIVSRIKKHPALLSIIDDIADAQDEASTAKLTQAMSNAPGGDRVLHAWRHLQRLPLAARCRRVLQWLDGDARIGRYRADTVDPRTLIHAESLLSRIQDEASDIVSDWANFFTDPAAMRRGFETHAPTAFTDEDIQQAHAWNVSLYKRLDAEGDDTDDGPPVVDREDDAILLRLHQRKKGWLRDTRGRVEYDHMMIDEVQDFTALEVRLMMDCVARNCPITLAGDTAQRIVQEGGFDDWDAFFDDLGKTVAHVAPLKIAYRSTAQVMRLATEVLGPLAKDVARANREGAEVEVHQFSDPGQAVDFLATALRELSVREPAANVAIVARHMVQARVYYEGLRKAEVPQLELITDQDFSFAPGVEVTDIRQVKGLEFDYVIMVDCNADTYPLSDEARHHMHVGITRAAHQLWLITTAKPSPLIPERLLDD
ncbi:MAG: ATP-binding domain-containing protein [Myxococcales bacterium]|jgi:DNA helicase-2/ATP-dependent DNA helicase PcrA|nr:ATP-binding domain-containing protein [Myxococcales bacterium]